MRWNLRPSVPAIDLARDVFPTPGGPVSRRIGAFKDGCTGLVATSSEINSGSALETLRSMSWKLISVSSLCHGMSITTSRYVLRTWYSDELDCICFKRWKSFVMSRFPSSLIAKWSIDSMNCWNGFKSSSSSSWALRADGLANPICSTNARRFFRWLDMNCDRARLPWDLPFLRSRSDHISFR
ncbi:hypothetical protein OGAPHI_002981 [Ogataea philodendri]|uniref:Uncharacterized protein n=1 Tax=Ogataea philodendri TaxID=1378263 RepID=A0A9P8P9M7_9ASCO|nr:uncharacterized protein OGAPHI_002981 [Ogataea philodendri]KAH3667332.1 hypothetical protein OGAPHI_002981 [Ogataea philodendri]